MRELLPEPGAPIVAGVKTAVTPLGNPVTDKLMAALKPEVGAVIRVSVFELPGATLRLVAEGVSVNVGAASTVTEIEACSIVDPLVPVTVAA